MVSVTSPTSRAKLAALPAREECARFIRRGIRPIAGRSKTLWLTLPAPVLPPEALLGAAKLPHGLLWDPPHGPAVAGLGWAHRIDVSGSGRMQRLRTMADEIWSRIEIVHHPEVRPLEPRLLGGLSFDPEQEASAPWEEFGGGSFTLPRFTYTCEAPGTDQPASLSLAFRGDADEIEAFVEESLYVIDRLEARRHLASHERPHASAEFEIESPDPTRWAERVEAIRDEIAAGRFKKIVAADRSIVELPSPVDQAVLLEALSRGLVESIRFAFCREHSTFLGATPERLVSLSGSHFETEALAGSIEQGPGQAGNLLQSSKDLEEHHLVVESIRRRLEPISAELVVAKTPQVRELRDVMHLLTPISGTLKSPQHILELVARLHPTPAVGGVPTEGAVQWIGRHEPARGWYAAPIGWFDAQGNGDFAVALRTCLLRRSRAYVYAGAGIVGDSRAELEYRETELKKRVILAALGAAIEPA